jgi:hypothetical protein
MGGEGSHFQMSQGFSEPVTESHLPRPKQSFLRNVRANVTVMGLLMGAVAGVMGSMVLTGGLAGGLIIGAFSALAATSPISEVTHVIRDTWFVKPLTRETDIENAELIARLKRATEDRTITWQTERGFLFLDRPTGYTTTLDGLEIRISNIESALGYGVSGYYNIETSKPGANPKETSRIRHPRLELTDLWLTVRRTLRAQRVEERHTAPLQAEQTRGQALDRGRGL